MAINRPSLVVVVAAMAAGLPGGPGPAALSAGGPRAGRPQQQEIQLRITGDAGALPRYAVPDFIAISRDAESVEAARLIGQVLWADLAFEREFDLIPRDTYATIPPARSPAEVPMTDAGKERVVNTGSGDIYRAKAVIISTGGSPNHLNVPGEREFAGKGVSYCAICDGAFFKNQVIAVVGGGDAAVEEGMFLTKFGSKVYLIHRRSELRAQKIIQQRAFNNPKFEIIWDSVIESINGDTKVRSLSLRNVKTGQKSALDVGAIFIFVGFVPNSGFIKEPLARDKGGYIITNDRMETSIKGIFCCGDVRSQLVRQITNAVGDGTTAAVAAEKYIEELDEI